ncbi:MAG: hypothetical protein IPG50_07120 [Myxococcales bacterium]|nr:hypothetical protein [Myxococcales bacterium]
MKDSALGSQAAQRQCAPCSYIDPRTAGAANRSPIGRPIAMTDGGAPIAAALP